MRKGRRDPRLHVEIRPGAESLGVACGAALPDGAVVQVGLWRGGADGPFDDMHRATATIERGSCFVTFAGTGEWTGQISAVLELHADRSQPAAVQKNIGPTGELLAYADLDGRDSRHVYATTTTTLPGA
jgi:hypothetical protein